MLELATKADLDAVRALKYQIHSLHVSMRPDIYRMDGELISEEAFFDAIENRQLYVAKIGGMVVGYVRLLLRERKGVGVTPCKILGVEEFCVDEACREQGIGREMITDVRALARAFGCQQVMIGGVYPENDGAIAFYQKCGFQIRNINMDMKL